MSTPFLKVLSQEGGRGVVMQEKAYGTSDIFYLRTQEKRSARLPLCSLIMFVHGDESMWGTFNFLGLDLGRAAPSMHIITFVSKRTLLPLPLPHKPYLRRQRLLGRCPQLSRSRQLHSQKVASGNGTWQSNIRPNTLHSEHAKKLHLD